MRIIRAKFLAFKERRHKLIEKVRRNSAELDCNLKYQFRFVEREMGRESEIGINVFACIFF